MPLDTTGSETRAATAEGEGNGSTADIKDIIGETVGLQFSTDEDALKFVKENKDNSSYVGKYKNYASLMDGLEKKLGGQDNLKKFMETTLSGQAVNPSDFVPRSQYETDTFYSQHPEFAVPEIRAVLDAMKVAQNKPLQDVVQSDAFKAVYEKYKTGVDFEKSKSVLESNPRLGAATNKITEAREAQAAGKTAAAQQAALDAVMPIVKGEV